MLKKIRFGIAAASLALVASACGGNDTALGPTVLAAVTHTTDAKTSKASMNITVNGASAQQTQPMTIAMDGVMNYQSQQGQFTVTSPGIGGQPGTTTQMIVDKSIVYTQIPTENASAFGGKGWLKIDANDTAKSSGVDLNALSGDSSPSEGLDMLKSVSDDVTKVGKEDVRGASTTHYKVNLDFAGAAQKETDQAKKDALSNLGQLYGNKPLPADVWIDGDKRIRKMSYDVDLSTLHVPTTEATQAATGSMSFEMEFYDFGTEANVTIPPADQVVDSKQLQAAAPTA